MKRLGNQNKLTNEYCEKSPSMKGLKKATQPAALLSKYEDTHSLQTNNANTQEKRHLEKIY